MRSRSFVLHHQIQSNKELGWKTELIFGLPAPGFELTQCYLKRWCWHHFEYPRILKMCQQNQNPLARTKSDSNDKMGTISCSEILLSSYLPNLMANHSSRSTLRMRADFVTIVGLPGTLTLDSAGAMALPVCAGNWICFHAFNCLRCSLHLKFRSRNMNVVSKIGKPRRWQSEEYVCRWYSLARSTTRQP